MEEKICGTYNEYFLELVNYNVHNKVISWK